MGMLIYQINTYREQRDNSCFPKCRCGADFIIEDHFKKRRYKELVGTVARCETAECQFSTEGYLGYDYDDLLKRVKLNGETADNRIAIL